MCVWQEFQEEIAPIQDDVAHMNQLASTFGPHDVQLSPANLEHIDGLNTRWRLLQVNTHTHTLLFGCENNGGLLQTCAEPCSACEINFCAFIAILLCYYCFLH